MTKKNEIKKKTNISEYDLVNALEDGIRSALTKLYGSDENLVVLINIKHSDIVICRDRVVVADGEVRDENKEIALSEARKIDSDCEVGDEVSEDIFSDYD